MTRIVAAAIQWRGKTLTLPSPARHSDIIKKLAGMSPGYTADFDAQGFVDQAGRFMDRLEAARVAEAAGQLKRGLHVAPYLFTEDLW